MSLPSIASGPGGSFRGILYRTGQFVRQLNPFPSREADSVLAALLTPEQFSLVLRLAPADRRHLVAVHRGLVSEGWTDLELLTAALLHDIGKADDAGRAGSIHRVLNVILAAHRPALLDRLARERQGWLRHGLYLSVHHAELGAAIAGKAGTGDRACWLIAHHDDGSIGGDPALHALRERDARE